MTADDRARLREAVEKATPGPWRWQGQTSPLLTGPIVGILRIERMYGDGDTIQANANLIAACDPQTILALLDALDTAEKRADEAERERDEMVEECDSAEWLIGPIRAERDALSATIRQQAERVKELEQQRQEARDAEGLMTQYRDEWKGKFFGALGSCAAQTDALSDENAAQAERLVAAERRCGWCNGTGIGRITVSAGLFYKHGGDEDTTVSGPCRECDKTGIARAFRSSVSEGPSR